MTPKQFLEQILDEEFQFEGGEKFKISLKPPLNENEIVAFEKKMPGKLPVEIKELLAFASGFTFDVLRDVNFTDIYSFDLNGLFSCPVLLCDDEMGNCWVLDVKKSGNWGSVFFVAHNPPVLVKQADNLVGFFKDLYDFAKKEDESELKQVQEKIVYDIWTNDAEFIKPNEAKKLDDEQIRDFVKDLRQNARIYDLREAPDGKGFVYGKKLGKDTKVVRYLNENLFAVVQSEKPSIWQQVKLFFMKLLGKK